MAIWYYSRLRPDGDRFLEKHWPYVSRIAAYFQKRADAEGMLDVAEEWICCVPTKATWPNAEVYGGLVAGAKIAARLGHRDEAKSWKKAARRPQGASRIDRVRSAAQPLYSPGWPRRTRFTGTRNTRKSKSGTDRRATAGSTAGC